MAVPAARRVSTEGPEERENAAMHMDMHIHMHMHMHTTEELDMLMHMDMHMHMHMHMHTCRRVSMSDSEKRVKAESSSRKMSRAPDLSIFSTSFLLGLASRPLPPPPSSLLSARSRPSFLFAQSSSADS